MWHSKKGMTLVELISALMVGIVAITVGFQLYYVGAKAHVNSVLLEDMTGAAGEFFESGTTDRLKLLEQEAAADASIRYQFDLGDAAPRTFAVSVGPGAEVSRTVNVASISLTRGDIATQLFIFKQSVGKSAADENAG